MNQYLYIFHGYGGENSLMPLANYMCEKGYSTLMIDDQLFPYSRTTMLQQLEEHKKKSSIVFITSAHLWFDEYNYAYFYGKDPSMLSAIELVEFLNPVFSVYYPHDLSCFMHTVEMRWIDLFDLVLLPYKNNDYYKLKQLCTNVDIIGWIKKHQNTIRDFANANVSYSPVFFPSNIIRFYQELGVEGYANWFLKHIHPSIPLKMPAADGGVYDILTKHGYSFLPPSTSVYDILPDHNLVIASGNSSIVYEAALSGLPVITLLDGFLSDEAYLNDLAGIKGIHPLHPEELTPFLEDLNANHKTLSVGPNILPPFDFKKVCEALPGT